MARPEDVTPDGLVTKIILKEGTGDVPPLHARCLVHYTARLANGGDVVMDSRAEQRSGLDPVQIVAGRTSALRATGLNLGVATMRKGEHCLLHVDAQYGYGDAGSFSFPAVPPGAALDYDVELLQWEAPDDERAKTDMLYEERLEAAERRRLAGNDLFKEGDAAGAATKYHMALSFLDEDFMMQLEGPHFDKANNVKLPLHLNLAACDLQLKDWHSAIEQCGEVLREQPDNAKAIFRRGRAHLELGNTGAAQSDLERAAALSPNDAAIRRQLAALKRERQEERRAQSKLFRGSLPPAPSPPQPSQPSSGSGVQTGGASMLMWLHWAWQALLQLLFPAAIWKRQAQART